MNRIKYYITFGCLAALLSHGTAMGKGSVISSPHNLSATGGSGKHGVAFTEEKRICVFCHVPHNSRAAQQLWSRSLDENYTVTPYESTTLKALPKPADKPTGASRLCLSCHDGTIAAATLENYAGSPLAGATTMPSDAVPTLNPNLTSNLSNDHPISFAYTAALAAQQGELASPAALPAQVRLDSDGGLQCTACHDPHNNEFGNFLVIDNSAAGSPLCVACHQNTGWQASAHNTLAPGCMNCHYTHNAPQPARLLHAQNEEDNCYVNCHDSNGPPSLNVKSLFDLNHRHRLNIAPAGTHDEKEALPAQTLHVECVDCHNPHRANNTGIPLSNPPNINGPLAGVKIGPLASDIATKEYEICFKCHAGGQAANFSGITETRPNRVINEPDQRKRFDGLNPSFHPVMAQRRGDGSSLNGSFQTDMLMIYCTDCHNSDESAKAGGTGPSGPHGSQWEHILMARYYMPPPTDTSLEYNSALYDLCYRCHNEGYIMGSSSGFVSQGMNEHAKHVKDRRIPCFACHDPHGIYFGSGNSTNSAHLINFDKDYAADPNTLPNPYYDTSSASGSGSCTVKCHTTGVPPNQKTHSYP